MIAALYCRVSSDSQRGKHTIETQKRLLADYAKREGWKIFDWYIDDGFTGTSIEARPAFTKLLSDAEARKFNLYCSRPAGERPAKSAHRRWAVL